MQISESDEAILVEVDRLYTRARKGKGAGLTTRRKTTHARIPHSTLRMLKLKDKTICEVRLDVGQYWPIGSAARPAKFASASGCKGEKA